jgi:phage shock protein A
MSLLKTLSNMIRGHVNDLDKALSDPARDGTLAIQDARNVITNLSLQLRDLKTKTFEYHKKLTDANADVEKYDSVAKKAAQQQNLADVQAALTMKAKAQNNANMLQAQIKANEATEAATQQHIDDANAQIDAAENGAEQAKTRIESAKLRESMASSTANLVGGNDALAQIDLLAKAADEAEARANATEEMAASSPGAKNTELLKKYEGSAAPVDAEAQALMAQFAKPSPAATA